MEHIQNCEELPFFATACKEVYSHHRLLLELKGSKTSWQRQRVCSDGRCLSVMWLRLTGVVLNNEQAGAAMPHTCQLLPDVVRLNSFDMLGSGAARIEI